MSWNIGRLFRIGVSYLVGVYTGNWALLASQMSREAGSVSRDKQRRRAIDAYNASLQDRLEMLDLQPDSPRTLVLGRVRYVEGVRRRWTSGTNEEKLTMIVSFAGHEIDAFEAWYVDDQLVTLDGNGWVQEAPYAKTTDNDSTESVTAVLDDEGGAVVVLPAVPVSGSVGAVWSTGSGENLTQGSATVVMSGSTATIDHGQPGASVSVFYRLTTTSRYLRIRPYLGTDAQNVGSDLASEYPGKITSTDRFAGIALAVVDVVYNPDVFPQGRPNITAVLRGAKCFDPRTSTTVWTQNPALHALKYATWAHGWELGSGSYLAADISAAADVCDVSTDFPVRGVDDELDDVTLPRYRCGITISADADHAASMDAIVESMAGRHGWAGGVWRVRAGVLGSTVATPTQDWLVNNNSGGRPDDEPVISAVQSVPREQRINKVTGSCIDPDQRYQLLPFPAVQDSVLIAANGERQAEVEFPSVTHIAHAQHLASMAIRQAQAGLNLELTCDERAQTLELFDVVALTMPRYGFSAKTFEVTGWTWNQAGAYKVRLAEITSALFTVEEELTGRDPAPDSDLRRPWDVEAVTGLAVESGTTALKDGSVLTRTRVSWDAVTGESIRNGGTIEVQYIQPFGTIPESWPSWVEQGSSEETVIPALMGGRYYLFRVRAVQGQPLVRGPWSGPVLHKIAIPPTGGTLRLTSDRFPFFSFADATTHTASGIGADDLVITARRVGLYGSPRFEGEAFDSDGDSLGTMELTSSGDVCIVTPAQFTSLGTSGSVRTFVVRATLTGSSDEIVVYRQDPSIADARLFLSNPVHEVSTDADGNFGDYTDALTVVQVYEGTTDVTDDFEFSIVADFGLTANINGGAGPVDSTAEVTVAVSNSTVSDGVVTIEATDGVVTLEGTFRVRKRTASGAAYDVQFAPNEIVLPTSIDGTVTSYATARSEVSVIRGTVPDTAAWSLTKEDRGVVSTLTGTTIRVTDFIGLGQLGGLISTGVATVPADWQRGGSVTWCGDLWVMLGYNALADYSTVLRSADFVTWSPVDTGTDGQWSRAAFGGTLLVAIEHGITGNRILRSADKGVTWTADTVSQSAQWGHIHFGDAFIVASQSSTAGSRSVDADTWANLTMPAAGCALAYAAPCWAALSAAGNLYTSTDSGTTWSSSRNSLMGLPSGMLPRRVIGYRGAIVAALDGPTNRILWSIDSGATWFASILPDTYSNPRMFIIVQEALYLVSSDLTVYCTEDGLKWVEAGASMGASGLEDAIYGAPDSLDIDYLPALSAGVEDPYINDLLLLFRMEGTGHTLVDSSGYGRTVTVAGDPGALAVPVTQGSGAFGFPSLQVTKSTSESGFYWSVSHASDFQAPQLTIEYFWYQTSSSNHTSAPLHFRAFTSSAQYFFLGTYSTTGRLTYRIGFDSTVELGVGSLTYGDQHHCATVIDTAAGTISIWVDGTRVVHLTGVSLSPEITELRLFEISDSVAATAEVSQVRVTAAARYSGETIDVPTGPFPTPADAQAIAFKKQILGSSNTVGFVRVTARKDGEFPLVRSLPVRKSTQAQEVFVSSASPSGLLLPATADGVVTDYTNATITARITGANNRDATAEYSWSWTATHLTPSSGSSNVATFTAMDPAEDRGTITFVAEAPGRPQINGTLYADKIKGNTYSGPQAGVVLNAFSFVSTYVALRLEPSGAYSVKVGSGGSWVTIGHWADPLGPQNEDWWVRVEATGHALDSGTLDTWLAMTANREYVLSDASSGTHRTNLTVFFATDNTGTGAVVAYGALELRVP